MDSTELLLQELTDAPGVSGYESEIAKIMKKHLDPISDDITFDKLGSIVALKKGSADSPRIMVAGHMDEVGFMVKEIDKNGYIKFLPLGGWWGHVVLAQKVIIMTSKGSVLGVVGSTPPHLLEADARKKVLELKDMYIDVGVKSGYDVKKRLGIRVGDAIVPFSPFTIMNHKKMYLAKAFDNRIGCAMVIDIFKKFQKITHPNTLCGVGTVQEEVGLRGAATAAWVSDPDVAIITDVTVARDTPGVEGEPAEKFGAGPQILVYDGSLIPNKKLRDLVIDTAEKNKMQYGLSYLERGGTDAGRIHLSRFGVPSVFIGLSTRYIHGHSSMIYRDDYNNCVKLIGEVIKRLDKKTVKSLTQL
jgi:putative aminopeptidase FrvX